MKKIFLGIAALAITFSAMAQDQNKEDHKHSKEWKTDGKGFNGGRFEKLSLTEGQVEQMKLLKESFRQQMQDITKTGTEAEQKAKFRQLSQEHKEKMMAVLTPEQRKQAAEFMKAHRNGKGDKNGGGRYSDITKDLNLSSEQSAKVASLNSSFKANLATLKNDTAFTQDQKKEQMKSLMKKHRLDVQSLLTPEQKEQLKNRRKKQPDSEAVK